MLTDSELPIYCNPACQAGRAPASSVRTIIQPFGFQRSSSRVPARSSFGSGCAEWVIAGIELADHLIES